MPSNVIHISHDDPGILKYADVDAVVAAATKPAQKLIASQRE